MMQAKHTLGRAREQALLRYLDALETGDGDLLADLLTIAARDPIFEQMVLDLHAQDMAAVPAPYGLRMYPQAAGTQVNPKARSRSMLWFTAGLVACVLIMVWVFRPRSVSIPLAEVTPMPTNPLSITNANADQVTLNKVMGFGTFNGGLTWNAETGLAAAQGTQVTFYLSQNKWLIYGSYGTYDDYVTSTAQTNDGRYMAVARQAGQIEIYDMQWNNAPSNLILTIPAREGTVKRLRYSPDGEMLAAVYDSETVLFDGTTGDALILIPEPYAVDVLFPGVKPVLVVYPHSIGLYNTNSGNNYFTVPSPDLFASPVTSAATNADFTTIILGYADGSARLWDISSEVVTNVLNPGGSAVTQAVFSTDHFALVTGSTVQVFDADGTNPQTFGAHGDYAVLSVVFSPTGDAIATAGMDGALVVQELKGGIEVARFSDMNPNLTSIAFSPDGEHIATRGRDGLLIWNVNVDEQPRALSATTPWMGLAYSPDGTRLAGLSYDGVSLFDVETGQALHDLNFTGDFVRQVSGDGGDARSAAVAFSPDGNLIAAGRLDGTVWLWNATTGEHITTLNSQESLVYGLVFSPDGAQLVVSSGLSFLSDPKVRVWDVASQTLLLTLNDFAEGSEVVRVAVSKDTIAATGGFRDPSLRAWNLQTGALLFTQPLTENALGLAFSPDGSLIASSGGSTDNRVYLWDAATGERLAGLPHPTPVTNLAFSPDGTRLATVGSNGPILIWTLANSGETPQ